MSDLIPYAPGHQPDEARRADARPDPDVMNALRRYGVVRPRYGGFFDRWTYHVRGAVEARVMAPDCLYGTWNVRTGEQATVEVETFREALKLIHSESRRQEGGHS